MLVTAAVGIAADPQRPGHVRCGGGIELIAVQLHSVCVEAECVALAHHRDVMPLTNHRREIAEDNVGRIIDVEAKSPVLVKEFPPASNFPILLMDKQAAFLLIEKDPEIDREIIRSKIPIRAVGNTHVIVHAVETESLVDLAAGKGSAVLECSLVTVARVGWVAIGAPPSDHSARHACARSTFARATGAVDGENFSVTQLAIENFDLVEQSVKEMLNASAGGEREHAGANATRKRRGRSRDLTIDVHFGNRTIKGLCDVEPLIERHRSGRGAETVSAGKA